MLCCRFNNRGSILHSVPYWLKGSQVWHSYTFFPSIILLDIKTVHELSLKLLGKLVIDMMVLKSLWPRNEEFDPCFPLLLNKGLFSAQGSQAQALSSPQAQKGSCMRGCVIFNNYSSIVGFDK